MTANALCESLDTMIFNALWGYLEKVVAPQLSDFLEEDEDDAGGYELERAREDLEDAHIAMIPTLYTAVELDFLALLTSAVVAAGGKDETEIVDYRGSDTAEGLYRYGNSYPFSGPEGVELSLWVDISVDRSDYEIISLIEPSREEEWKGDTTAFLTDVVAQLERIIAERPAWIGEEVRKHPAYKSAPVAVAA